jgi:hypothetical protein
MAHVHQLFGALHCAGSRANSCPQNRTSLGAWHCGNEQSHEGHEGHEGHESYEGHEGSGFKEEQGRATCQEGREGSANEKAFGDEACQEMSLGYGKLEIFGRGGLRIWP